MVESDSKNAIAWVNKEEGCLWNLRFYYNKLQNIPSMLRNVVFVHRNREANQLADNLAKEGSQMEGTWLM